MWSRTGVWLALAGVAIAPGMGQAQARTLTLGGAARIAAERGITAIVGRERASQQGAVARQARASLLPSLTSETVIDGGTDTPVPSTLGGNSGLASLGLDRTVDMRVRLTQPLLDLGALGKWKAERADADAAAAIADHDADRAAADGAQAYLVVLRAQARVDARKADSALAADLLAIARQNLQAGTSIALDVTRAESQVAAATSQLIKARSERARTELALLRALGLPIGERVTLADSLRAPASVDLAVTEADAIRRALLSRGDMRSAETTTLAAERNIRATRMERLPSVSAFAQAASNANGGLDAHTYGLQISVPVFDGLKREARIQEAQSRRIEAEARADDVRRQIEVEVRSAMLDLTAAREQVAAADVQLGLAEREVAQARERFTSGVAGNADVINAQLSLNSARDVLVDALTSYHSARVSLASAQGRTVELP